MNSVSREPLGKLVEFVQPDEKISPGEKLRIERQLQIALVMPFWIQFIEWNVVGAPGGFEMIDDIGYLMIAAIRK